MFTFSSKKGNRRREAKKAAAAAESQRPRLERRNAVKNIDYDLSRASTSSDESMSLRCTRSLDLSPVGYSSESSFRIGGSIDGEAEHIYRMLGLSGPDDFGIPVDAWEASLKARLSSDLFPRSRLLNSDSSPRNPEVSDLTFEHPAGSRGSDIPPESLVDAAALGEEVGVRPPETKESVFLEETGEGDEETEKISRPFEYRNYSDDAGISVTPPQPSVTASLSPASVHSPSPEFAPSTSKTSTVDNKLGSTLEFPVINEDNGFKLSTEASSDWAGVPVKDEEPVEIRQSFPVNSSRCDVGIKGTRPPVLIPPPGSGLSPHPMRSVLALPPSMSHPNQDRSISAWDIVRSFAPTEENEEGGSRRSLDSEVEELEVKEEEEEEEEECVENGGVEEVMERAVTLVETTDGAGSFSTTNDDDSSSTTTEFVISPNGHFKKRITSWMRGQLLGSGSFGTVYEGISDDGTFIAIKEVSLLDKGSSAQQCILQLEQEIALLSQFEHENIVQYYGTDKEESKLVIFLELVTQGSLASLYQKYNLRDTQVSAYTRQILNGLNYLHERNVVHRDIKCANILVHANGSVKLADFGLAKEISKFSDLKSCKGSVYWMAPEVVHPKKTYGRAADIWSLGCTVLELLTRQIPFPNVEWQHAFFKIGRGDQPPIPNHLSAEAQDFIRKCVQVDPSTRPSAAQLLEHPFITRRPLETFGY